MTRFALPVALCLLASAATAYAECAWVLWSKEVVSQSVHWSIERAASTEAECKAEGHKALVFWTRHQPLARVDTDDVSVSLTAKPGSTVLIYYRCLPDTIDPRGPKGK